MNTQFQGGLIIYEKKGAVVTVNLSGGCSVDFAYGAIYFYDNAHHLSENDPVTAYGFIMDKQEYDEYTDYQWWLGRTEDGSWDIVSTGY